MYRVEVTLYRNEWELQQIAQHHLQEDDYNFQDVLDFAQDEFEHWLKTLATEAPAHLGVQVYVEDRSEAPVMVWSRSAEVTGLPDLRLSEQCLPKLQEMMSLQRSLRNQLGHLRANRHEVAVESRTFGSLRAQTRQEREAFRESAAAFLQALTAGKSRATPDCLAEGGGDR